MWKLKVVGSKIPVHIISYNSQSQENVSFLKSLAHAANTKYVRFSSALLSHALNNDSITA